MEISTAQAKVDANGNGAGEPGRETFEVLNPATGRVIRELDVATPDDVRKTVARVRANQAEWEALGNAGRYRWLGKLRDWMIDNYDRIADTMQAETGKVRADAGGESVYLTDIINFYGERADDFIGDEKVRPHNALVAAKKLMIQYRPFPVVGVISPWNFPLILSIGDAIPALQAGAAVVIKPSEFTPLGLQELVTAWKEEIGGPDIFDCVHGMGETATELIDQVDYVQFTGLGPHRQEGDGASRGDADAGQPRARRQGPDDRPLRRRHRPRRERRGLGRNDEFRPDLHVGRADLRRGAGL